MTTVRLKINPSHPPERHIQRAEQVLSQGGVIAYPTDTAYGLGCDIYAKRAIERIYLIKNMNRKKPLSFVCGDLSDIAHYASVDNIQYRILRHHLPGPYTFILPATKEVPKILTSKTKTVGIRIPKHQVTQDLVHLLGHPIVSTTASVYRGKPSNFQQEDQVNENNETLSFNHLPENEEIFTDPSEIEERLGHAIDLILDVGVLQFCLSSIVDLSVNPPIVLRQGIGNTDKLF